MRYSNEVTIALPRDRVVALFDDVGKARHWQPGLLSREQITGTPGQVGSTARLRFRMGKREMEMIETVTARNLPDSFDGTYEAKGVFNVVRNRFVAVSPDSTKWITENEFRFRGFMKVIGFLMPGAFRRESQKYLDNFRAFAETGASVAGTSR